MMITVKVEISSFNDLLEMVWGPAEETLETISKFDMEDEFMKHLDMLFSDCDDTATGLNDYIAHEFDAEDFIAERINIDDIDDLDELEDIAKQLCVIHDIQSTLYDFKQENKEEELWEYIQDNFEGYSLKEVIDELETLSVDDIE